MSEVERGWEKLAQGADHDALAFFRSALQSGTDDADALLGMTFAMSSTGAHGRAEELARELVRDDPHLGSVAMAALHGAQGKRDLAAEILKAAVRKHPRDGFAWSLLGEQHIRQGRWDHGKTAFAEALRTGFDTRIRYQIIQVLGALSEAVAAKKIPQQVGLDFVQSLLKLSRGEAPGYSSVLKAAERALQRKQVFKTPTVSEIENTLSESLRESSQQNKPRPEAFTSPSSTSDAASVKDLFVRSRIEDSKDNSLVSSIRAQRGLNEELQKMVPAAAPLAWPSSRTDQALDTIESIGFAVDYKQATRERLDHGEFRTNQGDLISEIYLERCLNNLLFAVREVLIGSLPYTPAAATRLEMNLRDGFLEAIPQVVTSDIEEIEHSDPRVDGLGFYLGRIIERYYGGRWTFASPPSRSRIRIGPITLDPIGEALRWVDAQDREAIDFDYLFAVAAHEALATDLFERSGEYIDPTRELAENALPIKLGELWSQYRFAAARKTAIEIGNGIELVSVEDEAMVFRLAERWCPDYVRASHPRRSAMSTRHQAAFTWAYLRQSGEFLWLGGPKGLCRYFNRRKWVLDSKHLSEVIGAVRDGFCPGANLVEQRGPSNRQPKLGRAESPQLKNVGEQSMLTFWLDDGQHLESWQLTFDQKAVLKWSMNREA